MIENYQRLTRLTHLVMITALPGADSGQVAASMKLFAKEVLPHFRRKGRAQPKRS
jgi:hypothetical protein